MLKKLASLITRNAWKYLLSIGVLNLVRGFLHTVLVEWTATTITQLDLSVLREDRLVALMNYGWSNWL